MNGLPAAITGLGVVSPIGIGIDQFRTAIGTGVHGLGEITKFDAGGLPTQLAGEARGFDLAQHLTSMKTYVDRASAFALAAAAMALKASGWLNESNSAGNHFIGIAGDDAGLCLGSAWGCQDSIALYTEKLTSGDPKFAPPLVFTHGYANAPTSLVSIEFGLRGHNTCFAGGWTAGSAALASAIDLIRRRPGQRLIAGGMDALSEVPLRAAHAEGLLSADLCRPFDGAADGLLLGEGAALLALEALDAARTRNARVHGLLLGCGASGGSANDPAPAVARAIELALADAAVKPGRIDAVFASASGVPRIDAAEAAALADVFSAVMPNAGPPVVALKSLMGDPMGAWGPLAVVAAVCCMEAGVIPATANLRTPLSPALNIPREPVAAALHTCLVLNTSPSGYAAALVVADSENDATRHR